MAVYLPQIPKFVEYKPSMVGVPTQSVARLYDRLDRQAMQTQQATSKMKQVLADQIAVAPEGDKAYLQNMWNQVDASIEQASKEKNLPGYSRQIKKMVSDMMGDQTYAAVRNNTKRYQEADAKYRALVAQLGTENVMMDGDMGQFFSTVDPNTNEVRQFNGVPTRIPDFGKAMDQVFRGNTDIVKSDAALQEFIQDPENGALNYYQGTPGGRTHVNFLAQQISARQRGGEAVPYTRLTNEEKGMVIQELQNQLYTTGKRYLGGGRASKTDFDSGGMYSGLKNKAILASGQGGTVITDGDLETPDPVTVSFDDQAKDSGLDNQLAFLFQGDRDIVPLDEFNNFKARPDSGPGQNIVSDGDIEVVRLTGNVGPNGLPVLELNMKTVNEKGERTSGGKTYVEMNAGDIANVTENMGGFNAQLANFNQSTSVVRQAAIPMYGAMYAPDLHAFAVNTEMNEFSSGAAQLDVRKEDGMFAIYNQDGTRATVGGKPVIVSKEAEVRQILGMRIMKNLGING